MQTKKPHKAAPQKLTRVYKNHEPWQVQYNASPTKDLDVFQRSLDSRNRPQANAVSIPEVEPQHLILQKTQKNSHGLPRISSGGPAGAHLREDAQASATPATHPNAQAVNHSVSQEFEVHHAHNAARLATKRPSKRQARRVKYINGKNQKIVDDRYFLQRLAMNYYGSRPGNYLARDGNKPGQTVKTQQIMALLQRRSVYQSKAMARHQQRTTTDPKAMKQFQRERQRLDNLKSQMIGKLEQKRSQRRRDLQKLALATAKDPQKSEEQVLEEQRKAVEELEQMEVKKLKEQIQHEKEQVIAYWKMLQDGVDLEDEELAQIMKDLSECESDSSSSGQEATRKDDDEVSVREQDPICESEAEKVAESQDNSSIAETQLPQGEKTGDRSRLNDYHPIPMKRNRSTPFYRNMSTQKSKERTQNDFMLRRMQPMNVLTNATPFNPYKSTTPKGRKKERPPESATRKEKQMQYTNLGEYSMAKVNQTSSQGKRKASMAVGLPLKQQRPRASESNTDLGREGNANYQQRSLVASLPHQPRTHLGTGKTALSPTKVPHAKSQLDQQRQRRNNMKQHLTPVQVNKKTIDATVKTDPAANTTVIRDRGQTQKPKVVSDAHYVLPQLKREQIVFAKKDQPEQSEYKKTEAAQFYRSQEVDSAPKETKLRSSFDASERHRSIDKATLQQEQNSKTEKPATQNNRGADQRIMPSNKAGALRNDRYKEQTKGYEKLKLKYGSETQNGKESRPGDEAPPKAEASEAVKPSSSPNKKDAPHAQSLSNANAVKLISSKDQNPAHLTIKPKFIRHQNGSIHEEVKGQSSHYQSQFSEMYNSLGPYGTQGQGPRGPGQQRSHRKDLMQDSLLAAASTEEANQDLLIPRDKSHIASDSLMARLKLNERQLLNQRERDKIRAQSKYRARKMLEEQKQAGFARRGGDYAEQPHADSARVDTLLKLNHAIKTKRHMRSGVGLPQNGQLAHGTSLLKLLVEEDARREDTGRVAAQESSTARRRERKQVCAELLETQQSLRDFNLEIDAKYLEKDQTFGEMLQENIEAIPGFTVPGKQKAAQAGRGQDTIEAYTCYLKNLARSVQSILGFQDRDSETTRKFQNDLQPDGTRKMLVQIRNQIHQDSGETKKFDEVKKLIGTDKPEKRQKEKKKKYSYMQVSQMQEHHQTILVQIRNDIVGVGRVVNQYFYEQVENQWSAQEKRQAKPLPAADQVDEKNEEETNGQDKEILAVDQPDESPAEADPKQQKEISRMIDVAYGLESNSALFNEKFLRTTMTQEQRLGGEDSKVTSPEEHASSQSRAPEPKPTRRLAKTNSCMFNQEIQQNIEHLRHSYIDHLAPALQQKKSHRTQSCCQQRAASYTSHVGGPRHLRYSLAMNGDFKLQEADLNLAAEEVHIGDDESALRASHSRMAPTEMTRAAQQRPRLEKLKLREQHLAYSNIQLNQLSDRKMRQTTNTFVQRDSVNGDAMFPDKLLDTASQRGGSNRSLSNQFDPNDKSETVLIRNAYGFGNNHLLVQSNPLFSQKMDETKYTQANWLLPKINIEGKLMESEIECTREYLNNTKKAGQKSQQSGLLPDIKKINSESQFLDKDIPAEAAVQSGLFPLKADAIDQMEQQKQDYLQNEQLNLPSEQLAKHKSRNYNEVQSKSQLLINQKGGDYCHNDVSNRVGHITRSQEMIQIRDRAPLKNQTPLKGNFKVESDLVTSSNLPQQQDSQTVLKLTSGVGKIEVINIQNQAVQAARTNPKIVKSSQRAKKRNEQQTPTLQMEVDKIFSQQYLVSNQTSTKEARKRKFNSVERNSSQKSIGIMKMYIPQDMVVDNHRSQQDLAGAQETLTALIEMNNIALTKQGSQESQQKSLRSDRSNITVGRVRAYKQRQAQRQAIPTRKSSPMQVGDLERKRYMNITETTEPISHLISKQTLGGQQTRNGMNIVPQNAAALSPRDNYETLQTEIVRR